MTHKQVKFNKGRRSKKVRHVEEEYERTTVYRRPILLSCDDVARMAVESSRARLIGNIINKTNDRSPDEYTSYYRTSSRYVEPTDSLISLAEETVPVTKIEQVIPAYPSFIPTPWGQQAEPSTAHTSLTDITMNLKFNCKCENCTSNNCPARYLKCCTIKPCKFKDNIMTFCDRCTMTRNMDEKACGGTPETSKTKCLEIFLPRSTQLVPVKDCSDKVQVQEMYRYNSRKSPVPILKKCNISPRASPVFFESQRRTLPNDFQDKAVRDESPSRTSVKCFYKPDRCPSPDDEGEGCSGKSIMYSKYSSPDDDDSDSYPRKNIYNEGISDNIATADKLPIYPKQYPRPCTPPCPRSPLHTCSKTSVSTRYYDCDGNYIPHSHTYDSKYHHNCTKPETYKIENSCSLHHVKPSNQQICRSISTKPCTHCCKQSPRCIKLPKKLLTSERVLETCSGKRNNDTCRRR